MPSAKLTLTRLPQYLNASFGIASPLVIATVVKLPWGMQYKAEAGIVACSIGQLINAFIGMFFIPSDMVILASDVQSENAFSLINVRVSGIIKLVRLLQPENALEAIEVVPSLIKHSTIVVFASIR